MKRNPTTKTYKLVAYGKWESTYKSDYPNAVSNEEKTEVILSCNDDRGELTRAETQDYITNNWTKEVIDA